MMSMVIRTLMDRISSRPIVLLRVPTIIGTMFNFDGHGDVTCKQTLKANFTFGDTFNNIKR